MINFEERSSGKPDAIHTWFYPGENFGWEFVYPKSERLEVAAVQPPVESATPVVEPEPSAPAVEAAPGAAELPAQLESEPVVPEEEAPVVAPVETDSIAERLLPETAGYSAFQLITGISLFALGVLTVFAGLRRTEA